MLDPLNTKRVMVDNTEIEILVIANLPEFDIEEYDLENEKSFKKYVEAVKKAARTSYEYRQMIKYLRENMNMNTCSFYKNVNNINSNNIKIEIHHGPLGLHDICLIVINKRIAYGESLDVEMCAKEVMFLHYKAMVGLIPLSETVHELVGNQYLFVPADRVFGHYEKLIDMYQEFILPEQLDTLDRICKATELYNEDDMHVLSKKYIYVDVSGNYELPRLSDISDMISRKITELKQPVNNMDNNIKLIEPIYFVKKEEE